LLFDSSPFPDCFFHSADVLFHCQWTITSPFFYHFPPPPVIEPWLPLYLSEFLIDTVVRLVCICFFSSMANEMKQSVAPCLLLSFFYLKAFSLNPFENLVCFTQLPRLHMILSLLHFLSDSPLFVESTTLLTFIRKSGSQLRWLRQTLLVTLLPHQS